jgi:peptide deformylase
MELLPANEIPVAEDTPLGNLMPIYKTCLDLQNLCEMSGGIAISATQVGIPWKLFVAKLNDGYSYFVNCNYEPLVDMRLKTLQSIEGCISLRNEDGKFRSFLVNRYPNIKVLGKQLIVEDYLSMRDIDLRLHDDRSSVIFQHEIDHQFGTERIISVIGKEIEII